MQLCAAAAGMKKGMSVRRAVEASDAISFYLGYRTTRSENKRRLSERAMICLERNIGARGRGLSKLLGLATTTAKGKGKLIGQANYFVKLQIDQSLFYFNLLSIPAPLLPRSELSDIGILD